jgi:type IV secretion system protein VirB11
MDSHQIVLSRKRDALVALLGEAVGRLLADPLTTDVILNPPVSGEPHGRLWVARIGHHRAPAGVMPADQAMRLIGAVAAAMGKEATPDTPSIEGVLITDGCRFQGCIAPISAGGPSFSIRKRASAVFPLSQYVAEGKLTARQRAVLEAAVRERLNILIAGGTGSGKTTLLNAVILAMTEQTPHHRFVIIEDTAELQCAAPDRAVLHTSHTMSIRDLVRVAMRSFPDRIIIGETRGPEILDILQAWNTGHEGGACTIHANTASPVQALERVEDLLLQANPHPMPRMIARTVNLVVCIQAERGVRRVRHIARVTGHDGRAYQLETEA